VQDEAQRESPRQPNVRVVRMTPSVVSQYWPQVVSAVSQGLTPVENFAEATTNLMSAIMADHVQCWGFISDNSLAGVMTTRIEAEPFTNRRVLQIVSLYMNGTVQLQAMKRLDKFFATYARENQCVRIVGFSSVPEIIRMANGFGWNTDERVIVKEIE